MSDQAARRTPPGANESPGHALDELTDEVLPALIARLRASRLGELEVRTADWRVRLRRDGSPRMSRPAGTGVAGVAGEDADPLVGGIARSPALGYFT
ncbi:MAG TPA: hypothetical protein VK987_03305, partial [Anaerolineae bacterium]|nr:hypothetical protein [Anaerolineae bacterium]